MFRTSSSLAAVLALSCGPLAAESACAADHPVTAGASYTADVLSLVAGGREKATAIEARADAWVSVDAAAIGAPGVTLHGDLIITHGPDFSGARVGAFQTLSNVEAASLPHVYEAWAEWQISRGIAAKAGLVDLNSEFDVQEIGSLFLNSAHGIGPDFSQSGVNGPSIFPMTASALVVRATSDRKVLRLGVFDAVAGSRHDPRKVALRVPGDAGALLVAEGEVPLGTWELQVGGWHYTERFAALDPNRPAAPARGAYALAEGPVTDTLSAWIRTGLADSRANPIATYIGGGVALDQGDWRFGLAIAHARLGAAGRRVQLGGVTTRRAETVLEVTARRAVLSWLSIQPDAQYVVHPGWEGQRGGSLVLGFRLVAAWASR